MSTPRTPVFGNERTSTNSDADTSALLHRSGRLIAFVGVVLPLLLIGGMKFTRVEIEALHPLISGTPWLAWLHAVFGESGASHALGVFEIAAAVLLLAAPWSARAGLVGGALAAITFLVTSSILLAPLPVWDDRVGGFPALGPLGQFLIKDIALLGISLVICRRQSCADRRRTPCRGQHSLRTCAWHPTVLQTQTTTSSQPSEPAHGSGLDSA
jgi:reactive chlorine resistance protein C